MQKDKVNFYIDDFNKEKKFVKKTKWLIKILSLSDDNLQRRLGDFLIINKLRNQTILKKFNSYKYKTN